MKEQKKNTESPYCRIRLQLAKYTVWPHNDQRYFVVGELENGLRSGEGRMELPTGVTYEGSWKDNMRWGEGQLKWSDGSCYNGQFQADLRHGTGKQKFPSGEVGRLDVCTIPHAPPPHQIAKESPLCYYFAATLILGRSTRKCALRANNQFERRERAEKVRPFRPVFVSEI